MKLTLEHKLLLTKIGELCKTNRKMRGYTMQDVANEVKCPLSAVNAFENGKENNAILLNWYMGTEFDIGDKNE